MSKAHRRMILIKYISKNFLHENREVKSTINKREEEQVIFKSTLLGQHWTR